VAQAVAEVAVVEVATEKVAEKIEREVKIVSVASRHVCSVCERKVAKFVKNTAGEIVCLLHKGK
jgi:hypothetical protein